MSLGESHFLLMTGFPSFLSLGLFLVPLDGVFGVLGDVSHFPRIERKVFHRLPLSHPFFPDDFDGVVNSGVGVFLEKRNTRFLAKSLGHRCPRKFE